MNTFTVLMFILMGIGLQLGIVALAVQLGTHKVQALLERIAASQMQQTQLSLQGQLEQNLKAQQPPPFIPRQP